jgi:hypothetical protein
MVRDAKLKNGEIIGKVRIAPRGFRDNSEKAKWFSTSPTASSVSVRVAELLGMRAGLSSWCFDISDAFFSGELLRDDEVIYIKVPRDILEMERANGLGGDPNKPWRRLRREVPGCRGASSSWFRTLTKKLLSYGYEQLSTDPATFVKRKKTSRGHDLVAILPVHVDDGKLRATEAEAKDLFDKMKKDPEMNLSTIEKQELDKPIEFTGMTFTETKDGEYIDQNLYIKNKLQAVDVTKLRTHNADDELSAADAQVYGTCVGRLIWLLPTQTKHSYEISFLSRFRAYPRVKHLRRISAVINAIKLDPQYVFLPRFHRNAPVKLFAVVDAGAGEEADPPLKTRDHQCVALILVSTMRPDDDSLLPGHEVKAGLLSWSSAGVSRVSHASFDFEAISAVSSLDFLINVRELIGEILVSLCPPLRRAAERAAWRENLLSCELHSDSMGLIKAVRLGVLPSLSSRRRRDVLDLRDCMSSGDLDVFLHVDGPTNIADVGTKPSAKTSKAYEELSRLIHHGVYFPHKSKDYDRTFAGLADVKTLPLGGGYWVNSTSVNATSELWPALFFYG